MSERAIMSPWYKNYETVTYKNRKKKILYYSRKILSLTYKFVDKRGSIHDIFIQILVYPSYKTGDKYWWYTIGATSDTGNMIGSYDSKQDDDRVFKSAKDAKTAVMNHWEGWLKDLYGVKHYSKLYLHVDH